MIEATEFISCTIGFYVSILFFSLQWTFFPYFYLFFSQTHQFRSYLWIVLFDFLSFLCFLLFHFFMNFRSICHSYWRESGISFGSHATEFLVRSEADIRLRGKVSITCVVASTETKMDHSNSNFNLQLVGRNKMLFSICFGFVGKLISIVQL